MLYFSLLSILVIPMNYEVINHNNLNFIPLIFVVFFLINVFYYFVEMRYSPNLKVPVSVLRFLARSSGIHYVAMFMSLAALAEQLNEVQSIIPIAMQIFLAILFSFLGGYLGFYFFVYAIRPTLEPDSKVHAG
jgi:hypothetical protein